MKNRKSYLILKSSIFIFTISFIIFFIKQFLNSDFNLNNTKDLINLICLFISIVLLGFVSITNSKLAIITSILSYILYVIIIVNNCNIKIPNININRKDKEQNVICNGQDENNNDITINFTYKKDKISKINYTYNYKLEDKTGAENLVNHFDKLYSEYNNIYSEITISDKVIVNLYYNFDNIDINKLKELDENITDSYKEFKDKTLNKLTCKNRE